MSNDEIKELVDTILVFKQMSYAQLAVRFLLQLVNILTCVWFVVIDLHLIEPISYGQDYTSTANFKNY